ncbi:hypothetical protein CRUP_033673, partial [Coryphaenoides rupestris]
SLKLPSFYPSSFGISANSLYVKVKSVSLPTAVTCFETLHLPGHYTSFDKFKRDLQASVSTTDSFRRVFFTRHLRRVSQSSFEHHPAQSVRRKLVSYVPTVFENYTASFEIDSQRIELSLWDTSGSPYYDNVRPLSYPDSDAVLVCFDIGRPETLDSVLKKEFCPSTKMLLVGCKSDLRTDLSTLVELSSHRRTPVSYDQISAVYIECSAQQSENSVPGHLPRGRRWPCVDKTGAGRRLAAAPSVAKRGPAWRVFSRCPVRPELASRRRRRRGPLRRKDKAKMLLA